MSKKEYGRSGRIARALACALAAAALLSLGRFAAVCGEIRSEVVRLHILANSDSGADQELKLRVRDAVLTAADGLLDGVSDTEQALVTVRDALPALQQTAQACVYENGADYAVTAALEETYFTTRTYESGTLPAGWYQALRITIGAGEGHNWWCVVYPPLCLSAASDPAQLSDVLDGEACDAVEHAGEYEIRFKVVEWLEGWFHRGR